MRSVLLLLFIAGLPWAAAAEPVLATRNQVTVAIALERADAAADGVLVATFTPDPLHSRPLHLYAIALPAGGPGIPTRLELAPGSPLTATGPLTADRQPHLMEGLPVYPPGPVTLRLPVRLPSGDGTAVDAGIQVSYLACTDQSCLIPVIRANIPFPVPTIAGRVDATAAPAAARGLTAEEVRAVIAEELERRLPRPDTGIAWKRPTTVAEAEAILAAASGPVLLDFTGPSCLNCQIMEKTVFRTREVRDALVGLVAVQVDTDPPHDGLADWQQRRFQSQERPLYVRIEGDRETRWSRVFSPDDRQALGDFKAFLAGGAGASGAGSGSFWFLALLGGLVTLLMPCTYPMIPFTVNFFAKQRAEGRRLLPLALFYGAGIVGCFIGLGVLITGVLGASLATLAGHPVTNLVIAAVFVLFGLSLLGVFLLRVPLLGGGRGGYAGALLMGLTFAATAFSCTAPFAGSVLAAAVATGTWAKAVAGMAVYSLAIAVPFVALALSPGLLSRLPRAGAWMNELKVVGGLIELAAALKFLVIADHAWAWGVVGRTVTLVAWSATAGVIALYLLGLVRWDGDDRIERVGVVRLFLIATFLGLAIWFAAGVAGAGLGAVEGLFPGTPG